jgi:chromate reductase, NAD(P)H dehydrogenase (quinone)
MPGFKLLIVVGSLRKESFNLKLARAIEKLGAGSFAAEYAQIGDLPLYNQDLEAEFPAAATRLKNQITGADAVLFVTPEYNRSMPGVLKNAIDWASRPYGKNSFAGKPAAVCGASPGNIGTALAQHSLFPTLTHLGLVLMGQPEVFLKFTEGAIDAEGNVASDDTRKFLQNFTGKFAAWVERHVASGAPQKKAASG